MKKILVAILTLLSIQSFAQFDGKKTFHADTLKGYYDPGYKVYAALLTQADTNAPVATILYNTLGYTPAWSYQDVGVYVISFNDTVKYKSSNIYDLYNIGDVFVINSTISAFPNKLLLTVQLITDMSQNDNILNNYYFEIRIYP